MPGTGIRTLCHFVGLPGYLYPLGEGLLSGTKVSDLGYLGFHLIYGFKEVTASLGLCLTLWGPTFLSPGDSGQYSPDEVLSQHLGCQPAGRLSLFNWKQMIEILLQGGWRMCKTVLHLCDKRASRVEGSRFWFTVSEVRLIITRLRVSVLRESITTEDAWKERCGRLQHSL